MDDMKFEGLGLKIAGRPRKLRVLEVRDLDEGDLALLAEPRKSVAVPIKRLRERHHALARLIAQGIAPGTAGLMTGYSGSRVSILQADHAFGELVKFYTDAEHERYHDHKTAMSDISLEALTQIQERLESEDEPLSVGQLLEVSKLTLDRSGFGPSSKTEVDIKVGLADKLAAARKRVREMRDVTPLVISTSVDNEGED